MAFAQDVLMRIINVSPGRVFIAVNNDGNIYYLNLGGKAGEEPAWEDLGTLGFADDSNPDRFIPFPAGCAYGMTSQKQPVFVIVGGAGNNTSPGIIMASKNGKDWTRAFTFESTSGTSGAESVWAVVWDDTAQKFYAGGHTSDSFSDPVEEIQWQSETDVLFESPDGFSWEKIGSHDTRVEGPSFEPLPPWPEYNTGLLDAHCSKRWVDSHGNGVSDGYYGYDKDSGVQITPDDKTEMDYFFGGVGGSVASGITVTGGDPLSYPSNTGLSHVTCVATSGGKWVAAGGEFDPSGGSQPPQGGGKSEAAILGVDEHGNPAWKRIDPPGTNAIIALCGGLIRKNAGL